LLLSGEQLFRIQVNPTNRGTYWIRNEALFTIADPTALFLVNDSDDVSSLQRVWLHLQLLRADSQASGCFMDIVRVDERYLPMRLEAEIERYGTASLAFKASLIDEVGYFENVKRNADTEFIERCRVLKGSKALPWHRYPCLFQVFDGRNLTADIYEVQGDASRITADHSVRAQHTLLFRKQHRGLQSATAKRLYTFPESGVRAE
jgi:hypothetical protein